MDELRTNPVLVDVLERAAGLGLPGWYLAAGAVVRTRRWKALWPELTVMPWA